MNVQILKLVLIQEIALILAALLTVHALKDSLVELEVPALVILEVTIICRPVAVKICCSWH